MTSKCIQSSGRNYWGPDWWGQNGPDGHKFKCALDEVTGDEITWGADDAGEDVQGPDDVHSLTFIHLVACDVCSGCA